MQNEVQAPLAHTFMAIFAFGIQGLLRVGVFVTEDFWVFHVPDSVVASFAGRRS